MPMWILTPNMMVSGGGAFWRRPGREGAAIMNGISVLLRDTPESSLTPSATRGHSKKTPSMNQKGGPHQAPHLPALWPWTSQPADYEE